MERLAQVGDRVDAITLSDPDGKPVDLAEVLTAPTVIPLVRYYGCMPCQAYLRELSDHRAHLAKQRFQVVGVGAAADYQARHLMDTGVDFPLLLDPDHRLYGALNIHRIDWRRLLTARTWAKYLRSARRARQGRITDHPLQAPGLTILDTDGTIRYLYRGETLGDYPPLPELLDTVDRLAAERA